MHPHDRRPCCCHLRLQGLGVTTYNSATLVTLGEALCSGRPGVQRAAAGSRMLATARLTCMPAAQYRHHCGPPPLQAAAPLATACISTASPPPTSTAARCAASVPTARPRQTSASSSPLVRGGVEEVHGGCSCFVLDLLKTCSGAPPRPAPRASPLPSTCQHVQSPLLLLHLPAAADSYACGSAGVMRSATMWLGIAGGMLMTVLMAKNAKGAIVVGILFVTFISWIPSHGNAAR